MTTTYTNSSCNFENIVACLVSGDRLLHACISSILRNDSLDKLETIQLDDIVMKHLFISVLIFIVSLKFT